MKKLLIFSVALLASLFSNAQTTYTVTNTSDDLAVIGSLRNIAAGVSAGDIIRFSPALLTGAVDSISLSTEIDFGNKGVVIKGLYTATDTLFISGRNSSRIFSFNGAGKRVLDSVVLINGNGVGVVNNNNGGAVHSKDCTDTLHILNAIIRNNSANTDGGGVYFKSSTSTAIEVRNSILIGNSATNGGGVFSYSTHTSSSYLLVSNSTFIDNSAIAYGGGVYSKSSSPTISTSTTSSSVEINNSIFKGNSAEYGGGTASYSSYSSYSCPSSVEINNSTFDGNSATKDGGGVFSSSISYYSSSSFVLIDNSTFNGNSADRNGGGVFSLSNTYASIPSTYSISYIEVNNSTLNGNSANKGGGVYSSSQSSSDSSSSSVFVLNSTFSENSATTNGGGVYSYSLSSAPPSPTYYSSVTTKGSIFDGSSIQNLWNNEIISDGYNIFSDSPIGITGTDLTGQTINLQPLAFNGGSTQTLLPGAGSPALDAGDPIDVSDAQNAPIVGTRNMGAAENCFALQGIINVAQCGGSYTTPSGDETYTVSGNYQDTLLTSCGLDSITIINLTISSPDTGDSTATACDLFTWYGIEYNTSGMPTHTLSNIGGCDSVVTLNLTINYSNTGDTAAIACNSFTWYGTEYTSSATPMHTLTNMNGCDSVVTLDLTINYSNTGDTTVIACNSFTWYGTDYTSSGTPTHILTNAAGCDSVVTLNLTINTVGDITTSTIDATISATNISTDAYQWIDCSDDSEITGAVNSSYTATENGEYAVVITNDNCSDTSDCILIDFNGIDENTSFEFSIYPNPSNGMFTIQTDAIGGLISVTSVDGKVIRSTIKINSNQTKMNLSDLEVGTYFVLLQSESYRGIQKVVMK